MTRALLIVAAVADFGLAILLIAVSGFIIGSGPESMGAGLLGAGVYIAAIVACLALPVVGFVVNARGKSGLGLTLAWLPPAGALAAMLIPAPY